MIEIRVYEIGKNGFQRIEGFVGKHHVISLSDGILGENGKGIWTVSSSSALSTNIEKSKLFVECINQTFKKLEELTKNI
jgi:hypothetical protein